MIPIHTYFWLALRMCQPGTLNLTRRDSPSAALRGKPGSGTWAPAKTNPTHAVDVSGTASRARAKQRGDRVPCPIPAPRPWDDPEFGSPRLCSSPSAISSALPELKAASMGRWLQSCLLQADDKERVCQWDLGACMGRADGSQPSSTGSAFLALPHRHLVVEPAIVLSETVLLWAGWCTPVRRQFLGASSFCLYCGSQLCMSSIGQIQTSEHPSADAALNSISQIAPPAAFATA